MSVIIDAIPQQPQRQDSLDDQLEILRAAAIKLGCYDAAAWLRSIQEGRAVFRSAYTGEERYI